jgi:DNA-binding NtrC family response regulator
MTLRRILAVCSLDPADRIDTDALRPSEASQFELTDWMSLFASSRAESSDLLIVVIPSEEPLANCACEWLAARRSGAPVLAILGVSTPDARLRAVASHVDDFVCLPLVREEFHVRLQRLLRPAAIRRAPVQQRLTAALCLAQLVGRDPVFVKAIRELPVMAESDVPILITGETGTGKDLCARAIHHLSARRHRQFIPVDCGALPEQLFENELFGHARGAFTDARGDQRGLAALADGGTLFLDEIDALSHAAQAKLLRFLQGRTYKPLGADRFVDADVRLVAASNRDIEHSVSEKTFRSDLYYRLNVLRVHLPPLRERVDDVPLLAEHFVRTLAANRRPPALSPAAHEKLRGHGWPGNVRELHNVIQRALLYSRGERIEADAVRFSTIAGAVAALPPAGSFRMARALTIAAFERGYIEQLLAKYGGNITRAAVEAGKDRRAFGRLVKKYGIDRSTR